MSFTKNLRHRFNKHDRVDDRKEFSKVGQACAAAYEETYDIIDSTDEIRMPQSERLKTSVDFAGAPDTQSLVSQASLDYLPARTWQGMEEKRVFEEQLNQIQEQLMMTMIENQTLQSEINEFRNSTPMERLRSELVYERHRSQDLERKLEELNKKKSRHKVHRSHSDLSTRNQLHVPSDGSLDSASSTERLDSDEPHDESIAVPLRKRRFYDRLVEYVAETVHSVVEDFTEEPIKGPEVDPDGDPLTVKKLKDNIKRFGTEAKPYVNTVRGFYDILAWKSPPYTLIVFLVYMYSVWKGWIFPMIFLCLTFRLFVNYLRYRDHQLTNSAEIEYLG